MDKPYRLGGKADTSWNIQGLKSAISVNGTLNNPNDIDKYWTVELAIPLNQINLPKKPKSNKKVQSGDIWRINFSRVNWDFDLKNNNIIEKKLMENFYLSIIGYGQVKEK